MATSDKYRYYTKSKWNWCETNDIITKISKEKYKAITHGTESYA